MEAHGLLGCEDAPYVARRFLQNDPSPRRALAHLERVISEDPGCSKAHFELGQMLKSSVRDLHAAHEHFNIVHSMSRGVPTTHGDIDWYAMPLELQSMFPAYKSSRLKMQHDAQQLAMLLQAGKLAGGASEGDARLRQLQETAELYWEMASYMPETGAVTIPAEILPTLPHLGLSLHRERGLRNAPGEALVNVDALKSGSVLASFQGSGVAVINKALLAAPMARLYRWLTEATIWHYTDERGYVSAHFNHGLSSPLLVQLIEELQGSLLEYVFANSTKTLVFKEAWANRYDSSPYARGVRPTVEDADLKIVIWLTPRVKNMDPRSGGLRVWTEPIPKNWFSDPGRIPGHRGGLRPPFDSFQNGREFLAANITHERIDAWVAAQDRRKTLDVSYRTNSIVMFNPRLVHATDRYFFEQDYMSLRTGLAFTFDFVDVPTAKRNPVPMVPKPGQQVRAEL
eukprot:INCI3728.1.p1 GENE.INCI3728.1~~INCI3728.1.p1  ORF type:complete len:531 (-),score=44.19 INCI3728.1:121-1488(-)